MAGRVMGAVPPGRRIVDVMFVVQGMVSPRCGRFQR
jgi:hypothetical protein